MKALILAAGLGTRLRPLTEKRAKPSLPILGVPTVWFPIWGLSKHLPVSEVFINGSHGWDSLVEALADKELLNPKIKMHLSDERSQILGSSGALQKISKEVGGDTLIVINGDSICFPDFKKMLTHHQKNKSKLTVHLKKFKAVEETYSNFKIDSTKEFGLVQGLEGKKNEGVMFSGIYLIEPELLKTLPKGVSEFVPSLLKPLLEKKELFYYLEDAPWFDTGTITGFLNTNKTILDKVPAVQNLIEKKSYSPKKQVWLEKKFSKNFISEIETNGFCYFGGDEDFWKKKFKKYGPDFLGIEFPKNSLEVSNSNCIILSDVFCKV